MVYEIKSFLIIIECNPNPNNLHSPKPWPFLGPEVPGEFFYLEDKNLPSMCAVPSTMIFCSSLMLLAPGIFPEFWSIPYLISPSEPTIIGTDSVLNPHFLVVSISRSLYFESFSMTFVEVFRSDGTDTSISLQHRLAWSLTTISVLFADSSLSVCIRISQRIVTSSLSVTVSVLCSYHALLWDFNTVMLTRLPMDICSCLIVPLSIVRDSQI